MNILVIGGTRLLGLSVVKRLLAEGISVVVLSRHPESCPPEAECIAMEREEGLDKLSGRKFDITIDFIAFDEKSVINVFDSFDPGVYILISTTWIVRLNSFSVADQAITDVDKYCAKELLDVTRSYLIGKMAAENIVLARRKEKYPATILRLPIFWGEGEHTGRLDFYRQRICDGAPIICVNGGKNYVQLAWTEDIAATMIKWLCKASERAIWEAIPNKGVLVRDVISFIGKGIEREPVLIDIPSKMLSLDLPEYLIDEPLWGERITVSTASNLFNVEKAKPSSESEWIPKVAKLGSRLLSMTELRRREIVFLEKKFNVI